MNEVKYKGVNSVQSAGGSKYSLCQIHGGGCYSLIQVPQMWLSEYLEKNCGLELHRLAMY